MDKYETLQERPKKIYRIKFTGTVDVVAHCELEALAIIEGITINDVSFRAVDSVRELDEDEKEVFSAVS